MALCALTVDLDAYTGAETPFLLLIRFLSLNLYWNPSQAIIHMRMVYLLWVYMSFFLGKPHHFHFKTLITISKFIATRKWQKWVLTVTESIKSSRTSRWLYNLKDWIIFPWRDVENPFAGGESRGQQLASMWSRKTFCWVQCWQAGGTTAQPRLLTHLSGCQECHISGGYLRAREIAAQLRADN